MTNLTVNHLPEMNMYVFTRSGKTYDPPANSNDKTTIIHDDSDDEADEAKKEDEPSSSKPKKTDKLSLKTYKLKIPYPQRLHKEKMEERYAKFMDMIKEVRINVPLIDVLAGMPNYGKFLNDLMSNKSKMEQIFVAFLNGECSAIIQNKLPPKLGDLGSFLIPCTLTNSIKCLALADLVASINLIPYSLYASLFINKLKPTRMSIRLASHTYQYPIGVAENTLVKVRKFVFPVVKSKELNLGVGDDRVTFLIDKVMQHSHSNDDTCFRIDVIDEVAEEELDALLNDYEPFPSTSEKINETSLDKEFKNSWLSMPNKFLNKRRKSMTISNNYLSKNN
ncbi:reverse transcriptase domain-containing protein [Tanacetum coccineum]